MTPSSLSVQHLSSATAERPFTRAGPMVRIRFPPAESLRTIGSSAAEPIGNPGHRRAEANAGLMCAGTISGIRRQHRKSHPEKYLRAENEKDEGFWHLVCLSESSPVTPLRRNTSGWLTKRSLTGAQQRGPCRLAPLSTNWAGRGFDRSLSGATADKTQWLSVPSGSACGGC